MHKAKWRCYSEASLDAAFAHYVSGVYFCTRHEALTALNQEPPCSGSISTAALEPKSAAPVVPRRNPSPQASKGALTALKKQLADGIITREVYDRACQLLHCEAGGT